VKERKRVINLLFLLSISIYVQVIWKLQPTAGELQIEIIKEALELIGDNKELRSAENRSTCTPSSVSYDIYFYFWYM